jgi:hypothetical protein
LRSDAVADNLYFSGLANGPFFRDELYEMPDAMDTEMSEIDLDAMQAIEVAALQGDATDDNMINADAFDADAFDELEDAYEDEDTFENNLLDGEALENASQGKKLPSPRSLRKILLTTNY